MGGKESLLNPSFSVQKENYQIIYGEYKIKGRRKEMEDFSRCVLNLGDQYRAIPGKVVDKEYGSFFGIFDGHSGHLCAEYISEHLPSYFEHNPNYPDDIKTAAIEAFSACDLKYLKEEAAPQSNPDGCTACVVILWEDVIYVINSGDSRCILCNGGQCIEMSTDHRPGNPTEEERIKKCGGYVKNDRIRGRLAVARGFGAYPYKDKKTLGPRYVTVEPEIKTFPITNDTEFIIIASDGVWDKLTNDEAIELVRTKLGDLKTNETFINGKEKFVFDVCMDIVREADARQSSDNISCIIIVFYHSPATELHSIELSSPRGGKGESIPEIVTDTESEKMMEIDYQMEDGKGSKKNSRKNSKKKMKSPRRRMDSKKEPKV